MLQKRRRGLPVDQPCALCPARQPVPQPVLYRLPDRIGRRGTQAAIKLGVQGLELVPDLLLGPAVDLPPDPLAVWPESGQSLCMQIFDLTCDKLVRT